MYVGIERNCCTLKPLGVAARLIAAEILAGTYARANVYNLYNGLLEWPINPPCASMGFAHLWDFA